MIVKDGETLEEALQMLGAEGSVRYSDEYAYVILTSPDVLEDFCTRALRRNDIAIVVPHGHEGEMEDYSRNVRRIREQRAEEEKRKIKEWVKEHPEAVARVERKLR